MNVLVNGLFTGLALQLAIGPVFFFIINLALQKTIFDGFAGVLGVTLADYIYIALAIVGVRRLLDNREVKKIFGIVSATVLIILGLFILKGAMNGSTSNVVTTSSANLITSFTSVFFLTITNPVTIIAFTSLFTAKAVEYDYTKKDLLLFGLGTGFATFLFMGSSVILFSSIKEVAPLLLIQVLNGIVGLLLIGYGGIRLLSSL